MITKHVGYWTYSNEASEKTFWEIAGFLAGCKHITLEEHESGSRFGSNGSFKIMFWDYDDAKSELTCLIEKFFPAELYLLKEKIEK